MSISYKILWIDDQIDEPIYQNAKSEFGLYVQKLCFVPYIKCLEDGSELQETIKANKFDLILCDYKISDDAGNGDSLIKLIRNGKIYTEVLFYSAQPNFEEIAKELFCDRISFYSLERDERLRGFSDKVKKIIDLTLLKLHEVTNVRGLVMAETSKLDNIIEEILLDFINASNEDSKTLFEYIVKMIIKSSKCNLSNAEKLPQTEPNTIVKDRIFDASKKARAINKLLEIKKLDNDECFKDFHKNYQTDVIEVRNDLAHAKCETIDGIEHLILSRKTGEMPQIFDYDLILKIRKNLIHYNQKLIELKQILTSPK